MVKTTSLSVQFLIGFSTLDLSQQSLNLKTVNCWSIIVYFQILPGHCKDELASQVYIS